MQQEEPSLPPRQRILEAARSLVLEKGYRNATMRQICTRSGMSSGAIYHYFSGKDEIVAEALGEAFSGGGADGDVAAATPELAYQGLLDKLLGSLAEDQSRHLGSILLELIGQTVKNPEVQRLISGTWEPVREQLLRVVAGMRNAGHLDPTLDEQAVARVLHGLQLGLLVQVCVEGAGHVPAYLEVAKQLGLTTGNTPAPQTMRAVTNGAGSHLAGPADRGTAQSSTSTAGA